MSTRTDVGLAIKKGRALDELRNHPVLKEANEVYEHEQGVLFLFLYAKWSKFDHEIEDLYSKLEDFENDHLLVGAEHDYPCSTEYDTGGWEDNPFELCREVKAKLSYCLD